VLGSTLRLTGLYLCLRVEASAETAFDASFRLLKRWTLRQGLFEDPVKGDQVSFECSTRTV
jgi:hypothetical protein